MAKLTSRTASGTPAEGDLSHIVDISDLTDNPSGTSKKLTIADLRKAIFRTGEFTATAGGVQGDAEPLTAILNYITVAASTDDPCKMPDAIINIRIFVQNKGANSARLFPLETQNFFGLAADEYIDFPVGGKGYWFTCRATGEWEVEF